MKNLFLLVGLLLAVTLGGTAKVTSSSATVKKQRAVTTFATPVKLQGVTLKGEYLFVHDDAAMARGEACTFVYKGTVEKQSKLVASFHCTPAARPKVASFTFRTAEVSPGTSELTEFQFEGDSETHLVPLKR